MVFEQIDESKEKDLFQKLASDVLDYLKNDITDIKERLRIEREISKFQAQNNPDWLLNFMIIIFKEYDV